MPHTISSFDDLKLNRQLLHAVEETGYRSPTPVQQKVIPLTLAGHDVMGIAQTGTGKTAAYLLPMLMKLKYAQGETPRALVLAPTRELILQIAANLSELSKYTDLRSVAIYGGIGPKSQIEHIRAGVDILLATPGRLLDIYSRNELVLKAINTLVIDEADKMMDMGFMPQVRRILEIIPIKKQHLLFSATMPEKVIELSHEFLEFPEVVEITPQGTTAETVAQRLYQAPNLKTKINLLLHLLENKEDYKRVLIFTRTKKNADNVFKFLERKKQGPLRVIHANKGQNSRINAINQFKDGELRILVSTDVSARGIDVSNVSHVINFDVPIVYEDYVHRIGRTGRAHHQGVAITFANEAEMYHIQKIQKLIKEEIPVHPLPQAITIEETESWEKQEIARAIDTFRKKEDPTFQGAFHAKKKKFSPGKKIKGQRKKR